MPHTFDSIKYFVTVSIDFQSILLSMHICDDAQMLSLHIFRCINLKIKFYKIFSLRSANWNSNRFHFQYLINLHNQLVKNSNYKSSIFLNIKNTKRPKSIIVMQHSSNPMRPTTPTTHKSHGSTGKPHSKPPID